ncbi:nucleotidyltransferase family protein [Alphaproteobacteria bacterium]|nr:nucleotidyltransferase family protein [Alphaproteobacteria bacterium]
MHKKDQRCFWKKALIQNTASTREALEIIDHAAIQIGLVVDCDDVLLGTVTDGDIRRSILRGIDLDAGVIDIMKTSPIVCNECISASLATQLMKANNVNQLPVITDSGKIIGLHTLAANRPNKVPNQLLIMAGGFGKRLMPITKTVPKPMIKLAGKPMLEHIIEKAKIEGFYNILISVFYLDEQIRQYFGNGTHLGVNIEYLTEPEPLGTAGALTLINPTSLHDVVVTNGDIISNIPFRKILSYHQLHQAAATMAVHYHEWENPFGVVETNGVDILEVSEKPIQRNKINAGVYVINPKSINKLKRAQTLSMTDFFGSLIDQSERVVAYPLHEQWMDVGRHQDLKKAEKLARQI